MQPLNPFLRAFFSSKLPAQCSPPAHYVLFIPVTDFLLSHKDTETQASFTELASSEEVLASHVVRVLGGSGPINNGKDGSSLRESKGKAKQFSTLNGKTVVVKDASVFSNKGFKTPNQAHILQDALYYPDMAESSQWLIYYISKPLVGTAEPLGPLTPAEDLMPTHGSRSSKRVSSSSSRESMDVKSFADVLNQFPMIARQMQPGLEELNKDFVRDVHSIYAPADVKAPVSETSPERTNLKRTDTSTSTSTTATFASSRSSKFRVQMADTRENQLQNTLETLVLSAIDLFQSVDKRQLSLLGSSTDLSGPVVERMIERHVTEQYHDTLIFCEVVKLRKIEDAELDTYLRHMSDVDISQVGMEIEDSPQARKDLSIRLRKAVATFKRMNTAASPQEMAEILLEAAKCASATTDLNTFTSNGTIEKPTVVTAVGADTLVSFLLLVIIRSPVRSLQARLAYMQGFMFVSDTETGEIGYALSTFEAVLSYLSQNSGGLRKASRANRKLWHAAKTNNVATLKNLLEHNSPISETAIVDDSADELSLLQISEHTEDEISTDKLNNGKLQTEPQGDSLNIAELEESIGGGLSHVFPFQLPHHNGVAIKPKTKKHVSMDTRSMSSSSGGSGLSRTSTILSSLSMKLETSAEQICRTQDASGKSVLRMAIEKGQTKTLKYLLQMQHFFPLKFILDDCDDDDTTLLIAAVQVGDRDLIMTFLDSVMNQISTDRMLASYLARQDCQGRTVAHYLFNAPYLIEQMGRMLPWRLRDKNGQTPLFALCRSYDHAVYSQMIEQAIHATLQTQSTGDVLHLDDHIDNRRNTLLHIVNDPMIVRNLLNFCDNDPNAVNEKQFTPMMVASRFARLNTVRIFFNDERTDLQARDLRGLTAVELAKDDEVRNRMDDMMLLAVKPLAGGRQTTIVRSILVEDGSTRMIIKSGAPSSNSTITVTTSRRTPGDFENLVRWLSIEHPASWLPLAVSPRSPFQIPSKPSRSVLRDMQLRLEGFLDLMLVHPTFSTHEMLWEFFLVPDIDPNMLAERTRMKAESRLEKLREEYEPILLKNVPEVELFVSHAHDQVRSIHNAYQKFSRRLNATRNISADLFAAHHIFTTHVSNLALQPAHILALRRHVACLIDAEHSPATQLQYALLATLSATTAILHALERPALIIGALSSAQEQLARHTAAASRSQRWPSALGLLDDTRARLMQENLERAETARAEVRTLGCELRYTQATVAAELAGWQAGHAGNVRDALRTWVRRTVVTEKARLQGMRRAMREIERAREA